MPADADIGGEANDAGTRQRAARAVTMWMGDVDGDDQDADWMDVRGAGADGAGTPG
jgi:hypothetical protein